ncbi:MAG: hypothetical protein EBV06_11140 [Planctomycetia bacterium]|nr:hypothetical protein [Planctomycetia bacterium]
MMLRCVLDGLILPAMIGGGSPPLTAWDGNEVFRIEAVESRYYEVVTATPEEWQRLESSHYRLLRRSLDFKWSDSKAR